jgi:hypothetical protein
VLILHKQFAHTVVHCTYLHKNQSGGHKLLHTYTGMNNDNIIILL